jgi:hypothetical protein
MNFIVFHTKLSNGCLIYNSLHHFHVVSIFNQEKTLSVFHNDATNNRQHGLRRTKACRTSISMDHLLLRSCWLGDWIYQSRFLPHILRLPCSSGYFGNCKQLVYSIIFYSSLPVHSNHILLTCSNIPLAQICVPDWPFFNRHPVKWLESVPNRRQLK